MTTLKFKTNINCGGCVKAVPPHMNAAEGIREWTVNTEVPEKVLTVAAEGMEASQVVRIVEKAGFKAEEMQ